MEDWVDPIRTLVALAITFFLVILRLEAEKFGAAEYDEPTRDGRRTSFLRRLSWILLGFALVGPLLLVHPDPAGDLGIALGDRGGGARPRLRVRRARDGPGDRLRALPLRPDPLPARLDLPGRGPQRDRDGLPRRGDLPGRRPGAPAPGRDRPGHRDRHAGLPVHPRDADGRPRPRALHVPADADRRARGRLADGRHRGDRGGVPGPRHHPDRGLRLHRPRRPAGAPRPGDRGDLGVPPGARRAGASWTAPTTEGRRRGERRRRRAGPCAPSVGAAGAGPFRAGAAGGPARDRRSRSTSTSRSAARSARTATSWSTRAPTPSVRGAAWPASWPGSARAGPARRRARRGLRAARGVDAAGPRDALPRWRHAVAPAGRRGRGARRAGARAVRAGARRRGDARGEPRPRRPGRPARASPRPASPASRSAPRACDDGELRALGRRHRAADVADAVAAARAAGIAQLSLDLLYDVPGQRSPAGRRRSRRRSTSGPDHVSCYALTLDDPDAEGLTGPSGDHLPTTAGARRWRERARGGQDEDRAAAAYGLADAAFEGAGHALVRALELGPPGGREPPQPRLLEAPPVRGGRPGGPRASTGSRGAGTRARLDAWLGALAPADGGRPPGCRRAAPRRSTRPRPRPRRSSWACARPAGSPARCALTRPDVLAWAVEAGLVEDAPGRSRPPHAPRPAALQRAVHPPRLTAARRPAPAVGRRPCRDPWSDTASEARRASTC